MRQQRMFLQLFNVQSLNNFFNNQMTHKQSLGILLGLHQIMHGRIIQT